MCQCERILRHMKDYGSITQAEAVLEYGCYRLSGRIYDLKKRGIPIGKRNKSAKNRYGERVNFAEYYIIKEENHA